MFKTDTYRIPPDTKTDLVSRASDVDEGLSKSEIKDRLDGLRDELVDLQELLYADGRFALLVVLQAMDAAGKDSTVRHVFSPVNPQGCHVHPFKPPTEKELSHDFLWRIHHQSPAKGMIGVFNRSQYEDVLAVRVRKLAPPAVWKKRYSHINDFERMLVDEGTVVVKFYLHISADYQTKRFRRRLEKPDKHWKFNPADIDDREHWDDYMVAYNDVFRQCSPEHAPWYIVPAENRRFRDLLVTQVLVEQLKKLNLRYPKPTFDTSKIDLD